VKEKVAQYMLAPRGDVDGLLLDDGTECTPVHDLDGTGLRRKARRCGNHPRSEGQGGAMVAAASITNDATGTTSSQDGPRSDGTHASIDPRAP